MSHGEPFTFRIMGAFGGALAMLLLGTEHAVAQAAWTAVDGFSSRYGAACAYDSARSQVVLFGGNDGRLRDDTWIWNGTEWTRLSPSSQPLARVNNEMVYDTLRGRSILFGTHSSTQATETWSWDGTNWTQIPTANTPPNYGSYDLAYDQLRDRVVLWGGAGAQAGHIWEFDGNNWTEIQAAHPLFQSTWGSIEYDADAGNVVLYRPNLGSGLWRWDGSLWSTDAGPSYGGPGSARIVHDPVLHRLLLVGGFGTGASSTHVWNTITHDWQVVATNGPEVSSHAAVFDQARGVVVAVGGYRTGTGTDSSVWELAGNTWQRRTHAPPGARREHTLAFDRATDRLFLFGGRDNNPSVKTDAWVREQGQWRLLIPTPPFSFPPPLHPTVQGARLIFDEARDELLLLGGVHANSFSHWRLDGNQWQRVQAPAPTAREGAAVAYDRLRQRVILFGGEVGSTASDETWIWDGTTWTEVQLPVRPSARERGAMAYDAARDRVVLTGGFVQGGSSIETWEFDGQQWELCNTDGPPGMLDQSIAYDETRQIVTAFPAYVGSRAAMTWQWNGTLWTSTATATTPVNHGSSALISTAQELLMHGGVNASGTISESYQLATPTPASSNEFGIAGTSVAGPLTLELTSAHPWLETTAQLRLQPIPAITLVGLWLGWSRTQWLGASLPIDLAAIGHPGNQLLISLDATWPVLNPGQGVATSEIDIPNTTGLLGSELHLQGLAYEPLSGALTTSNALTFLFGSR